MKSRMSPWKNRIKEYDRTLLELLTGILVFGILGAGVGFFLPFSINRYLTGFVTGIFLSALFAVQMQRNLQKALYLGEKSAISVMITGFLIRYILTGGGLILFYLSDTAYPLSFFAGVMGLKVSAYGQPFTHKFYLWLFHESDPIPLPLEEEEEEDEEEEDRDLQKKERRLEVKE